jgi:hypothetical protein
MYFDNEVGMSFEVPFHFHQRSFSWDFAFRKYISFLVSLNSDSGRERSGYRVEKEDVIMPIVYTFRSGTYPKI